jgi:hypothetical protein
VCFWEDDNIQLRWPEYEGGANTPSLIVAQRSNEDVGAMESRFLSNVRSAQRDEPVEVGWRPLDPAIDNFERKGDDTAQWPGDLTVLYWWRPTFWRRDETST